MNSYEYEEEREIDLRNLIMYVLLRWRSILIVALIGALLGGAVSYFRSAKTLNGTEESAVEYEALLEQKEESLSGAEAAVAGMEQIIDRTSQYILMAPLMKIDQGELYRIGYYFEKKDVVSLDAPLLSVVTFLYGRRL